MPPQGERSARRQRSQHQLLNLIREQGSITRSDLARLTGLSRSAPDKALSLACIITDPVAARVVTEAGRTLDRVLAELSNCLNPAAIILGGELGTAGRPFVAGVRESVDRYAQPAISQALEVRAAELGLRSELMGAVSRAMDHAQR